MQIADTHTHGYFGAFDADRDGMIARAQDAGVNLQVQIGCDEISCLAALEMAEQYEDMYATLGLHPCDVHRLGNPPERRYRGLEDYQPVAKTQDQFFEFLEEQFQQHQDKVVGFGETGFDFYHQDTPQLRELQAQYFTRHVELTHRHNRAVVIHTRGAAQETLDFIRQNPYLSGQKVRGVVHCFSENTNFAQEVTQKYGLFLGIGGVATYPNAEEAREAIRQVPLRYLVTETDAPFLTPQGCKAKGKRNEPAYLTEVVGLIAQLKDQDPEEVAQELYANAQRLYGLT